tara:strand:+ start:1752 stop:3392 length:1641 start_codon:yes stop_codon:yes gene_type:complete
MKNIFKTILFFFSAISIAQDVGFSNILDDVYPDKNNLKFYKNYSIDSPKNTIYNINLVVKCELNSVIEVDYKSDSFNEIIFSEVLDVPVEQNTGLDSRTERFKGDINPYVIRRAPFRIFEIIKPIKSRRLISKSNFSLINVKIPIAKNLNLDKHQIDFTIYINDQKFSLKLKINIHDIIIPELEKSNFFYTNWFNLSKMEEYHELERWSKDWYIMLDKYAKMMAYGRQNCVKIPAELIYIENDEIFLNEERMMSFINVFLKYGFKYFESPHLLDRGKNDDWGNPELITKLRDVGYYSDEGKKEIEDITYKIKQFTEKYNLSDKWLQHIADEPTSVNAQCYIDVANQIKNIHPDIQIMEATNTRESLGNSIDIWCPIINDFQENEDFFRSREKLGEKILVYTCLVPGGKWLNRTLDMEKIRQVYFGWGGSKYNTMGYLHWGLNQYKANPFENSVVKHPSPAAGPNNFLPAGDTHIIYPGKNGPLSSLRFESHRIGCEDYEILESLKKINPKKHKLLINKIFKNYTLYSINIKKYNRIKSRILKTLKT